MDPLWRNTQFTSGATFEIPVALQVQVSLVAFGDREDEPDLRSDADSASFKVSKLCAGTAIGSELLEEITNQSDLDVLEAPQSR